MNRNHELIASEKDPQRNSDFTCQQRHNTWNWPLSAHSEFLRSHYALLTSELSTTLHLRMIAASHQEWRYHLEWRYHHSSKVPKHYWTTFFISVREYDFDTFCLREILLQNTKNSRRNVPTRFATSISSFDKDETNRQSLTRRFRLTMTYWDIQFSS